MHLGMFPNLIRGSNREWEGDPHESSRRVRNVTLVGFSLVCSLGACDMLSHFIGMEQQSTVFPAGHAGASATIDFVVPTSRYVGVYLVFNRHAPNMSADQMTRILGDGGYDPVTGVRLNNGIPIPLTVVISSVGEPDGLRFKQDVFSEELESWGPDDVYKKITGLRLKRGHYEAVVVSREDVPIIHEMSVRLDVHAPSRK